MSKSYNQWILNHSMPGEFRKTHICSIGFSWVLHHFGWWKSPSFWVLPDFRLCRSRKLRLSTQSCPPKVRMRKGGDWVWGSGPKKHLGEMMWKKVIWRGLERFEAPNLDSLVSLGTQFEPEMKTCWSDTCACFLNECFDDVSSYVLTLAGTVDVFGHLMSA